MAETTEPQVKEFTEEEVAKHNKENDAWLIIGNDSTGRKIYDVSKYLDDHPGGSDVMLEVAGKDADEIFEATGHSSEARTIMKKYLIGKLKEDPDAVAKRLATKALRKIPNASDRTGLNPFAVLLLLVAVAIGVYFNYFANK